MHSGFAALGLGNIYQANLLCPCYNYYITQALGICPIYMPMPSGLGIYIRQIYHAHVITIAYVFRLQMLWKFTKQLASSFIMKRDSLYSANQNGMQGICMATRKWLLAVTWAKVPLLNKKLANIVIRYVGKLNNNCLPNQIPKGYLNNE